ncbi:MAG TPA: hypothetical protein VG847_01900 [Chitinophagaceae bacterium]|nr:hypothetical protein [Chitinophagaceae bacterium]
MRHTLLIAILLLFLGSCTKDKFSSTPSLKFKSVNTTNLYNQGVITFTMHFTDAEGDLTDSIFMDEMVANCPASDVSGAFALPSFPATKNVQGDITVTLGYNRSDYLSISPQCQENDTAVFRFALRDKALHISDTVSSPVIIIHYQ